MAQAVEGVIAEVGVGGRAMAGVFLPLVGAAIAKLSLSLKEKF